MSTETRTDKELRKLAVDFAEGHIFSSAHMSQDNDLPEQSSIHNDLLSIIFLPLTFMDKDFLKKMEHDEISVVYEYVNKAGPTGINGYPCFYSCRMLNKEEWQKLRPMIIEYEDNRNKFIQEDNDEAVPLN